MGLVLAYLLWGLTVGVSLVVTLTTTGAPVWVGAAGVVVAVGFVFVAEIRAERKSS